ncbi:MAG: hypothetical protein AAGI11_12195 [Pseudomonadota bacterium]
MAGLGFVAASGILLGMLIIAALCTRRDANRLANALLAASLGCTVAYLAFMVVLHAGLLDGRGWLVLLAYPIF